MFYLGREIEDYSMKESPHNYCAQKLNSESFHTYTQFLNQVSEICYYLSNKVNERANNRFGKR